MTRNSRVVIAGAQTVCSLDLEEAAHLLHIEGLEAAPIDAADHRLARRLLRPFGRLRVDGWSFTSQPPIGWRDGPQAPAPVRRSFRRMMQMSWTDERIDRLKTMWTDGATASQIADELGGVCRNAVIGKAHRLGLEARPSPVKPGEEKAQPAEPRQGRRPRPRRAPEPAAGDAEAGARNAPAAAAASAPARPSSAQARRPSRYRSVGPGGFIRQGPGDSRRRSRRRRRAGWSRPSRAPRSPTRPACSISTTGSANGRSAIPASPISISAARPANPGFPYCVEHCGVAYQAQLPRRDRRAAAAAAVRRARGSVSASD